MNPASSANYHIRPTCYNESFEWPRGTADPGRMNMTSISTARFPNSVCPRCGKSFGPDADVRSCIPCGLSFHANCWTNHGGCTTASCENAGADPTVIAASPTAAPRPSSPLRPTKSELPIAPAPHEPDHSGAWIRTLVVFTAAAALVTGVLAIWHWHHGKAKRELMALIRDGEAQPNPAALVASLESYVAAHPSGDVTQIAGQRLTQARADLEVYDFAEADAADRPADPDFDAAEAAYRHYLAAHPDGPNRPRAEARIKRLADDRDDHLFEQSLKRVRSAPLDLAIHEAAWNTYLEAYPSGRHASDVRAQLVQLPEKAERLRFSDEVREIRSLVEASRFEAALDRVDQALATTKSASRRAELKQLAGRAGDLLEIADAKACIHEPGPTREERDAQRRQCKLFLLCYPTGSRRASVADQIARLAAIDAAPAEATTKAWSEDEILEAYTARIIAGLEQAVRKRLPGTFDYRLLGSTVATVPILWSIDEPTHRSRLLSEMGKPFHGTIHTDMKATVRRDSSASVRDKLKNDIDEELRSISSRLRVSADFEIESRPSPVASVGVDFDDSAIGVVVARVIPGSAAATAGLETGDRIVRVDETPVPRDARKDTVEAMIANASPAGVELTFVRSARRFRVVLPRKTYSVPRYKMRTKVEIAPARPFGEPPHATDWTDVDPPS